MLTPAFIFATLEKSVNKYSRVQCANSLLMILSLVWLTVSIPFVYNARQQVSRIKCEQGSKHSPSRDQNTNPLANTTEEKPVSTISISEEYLHHHDHTGIVTETNPHLFYLRDENTYTAFHGELLTPPPNFQS